jgi:YD repeat-containing protein
MSRSPYTAMSRSPYTKVFDAENRLVHVTANGETTEFIHDGDGNRVKKIDGDGATAYVGGYYEELVPTSAQIVLQPGPEEGMDTYVGQSNPDNSCGSAPLSPSLPLPSSPVVVTAPCHLLSCRSFNVTAHPEAITASEARPILFGRN